MIVDSCYLLNYNAIKQPQQFLILVQLLHVCLGEYFLEHPDNCIVSSESTSNL